MKKKIEKILENDDGQDEKKVDERDTCGQRQRTRE